jgi:hypothetical protein
MLRHINKFINVEFKITECEDDIESSDDEEENKEVDNNEHSFM